MRFHLDDPLVSRATLHVASPHATRSSRWYLSLRYTCSAACLALCERRTATSSEVIVAVRTLSVLRPLERVQFATYRDQSQRQTKTPADRLPRTCAVAGDRHATALAAATLNKRGLS